MPKARLHHVVILLCLSAGLLSCGGGAGGQEGPPLPELTPFDEQLSLQLAGIATTASDVRGLPLNEGIEQGTMTDAALAQYYEDAATEAVLRGDVNYDALNTTYRLLHMIEPDDSILDAPEGATGILGFYAHDGDQLALISDAADELSLDNEATLAHEYVHSFQDKAFDLSKLMRRGAGEEQGKANTEYADAITALVEGDATVAMFQYVEKMAGEEGLREWLASSDEAAQNLAAESQDAGPPAFGRYAAFPYVYGSAFVRYLYDDGGWGKVDAAYEDPPQTEEQIIHPEKYLGHEEAVPITLRDVSSDLGEGWVQEQDSLFGEFDVYNWIRSTLDNEFQATSAAAGWGGGRIAVYSNAADEGRVLVHIVLMWDSTQEAREFYTAFADTVKLIDPEPEILDPSLQMIGWEGEDEAGEAWIVRQQFQMVVGVRPEDIEIVKTAIEAPESIPASGYILQEDAVPQAPPPITRMQDALPNQSELPAGFVLVESGDQNIETALAPQPLEQRYAFYMDARSPGDGLLVVLTRERGALAGGWAALSLEDPRATFETLAMQAGLAGDVSSFEALDLAGVGEGAVGGRGEIATPDGAKLVQAVAFGRGPVLALVVTIRSKDVGSAELDIKPVALGIDGRLSRLRL